jgi:hypothetical protein
MINPMEAPAQTKTCIACNVVKELKDFPAKRNQCKACRNENGKALAIKRKEDPAYVEKMRKYREQYNAAKKETIAVNKKKYAEKNKEKTAKYQSEYREVNRDKLSEYKKKYHEENAEMIAQKAKAQYEKDPQKYKDKCKKYYNDNKEVICEKVKTYRVENADKIVNYHVDYCERNSEKIKERKKKYYVDNKEQIKRYKATYMRERRQTDIEFKITCNLRTRLRDAVKRDTKSAPTLDLLGCNVDTLKEHLEAGFDDKMTWDNYGTYWHVDHIRPCASFDLTDPVQQRECFHWSNLQPLEAIENIRKGAKLDWVPDE